MASAILNVFLSSPAKRGRCLAKRGGGGALPPIPPSAAFRSHSPRKRGEKPKGMTAPYIDGDCLA
jgi:hypothetical protein